MIEKLIQLCQEKQDSQTPLYIQTHDYPDMDAIASAWGLQSLLAEYGIRSEIRYVRSSNRVNLNRIVRMNNIEMHNFSGEYSPKDSVILVDCQAGQGNVSCTGVPVFACIDHHPVCDGYSYDFRLIEQVGACASLITREYSLLKKTIPTDVATTLLFAIKSDTQAFSRGVTEQDIDAFKILYPYVNWDTMSFLSTSDISLQDLTAYGDAIKNIHVLSDIGMSFIPFDCPDALIGSISDFILSINELSLAIVCSRRENGIKLSVRSILPYVNAGEMTKHALDGIGDGGGHAMFAGGFIPEEHLSGMSDEQIYALLSDRFMKAYRQEMLTNC